MINLLVAPFGGRKIESLDSFKQMAKTSKQIMGYSGGGMIFIWVFTSKTVAGTCYDKIHQMMKILQEMAKKKKAPGICTTNSLDFIES